jgi:hypothetical protein
MKAAVDTFLSGLNDLTGFLRNAERESALTSILLRDDRFSLLSSEAQNLLSEISKAGTSKRQYIYAVAIVGLYGLLERFVDSILESYVAELSHSAQSYDKLPEAVRKNHLPASIELLKAINEERYRGDIQISDVIANLHSCMTGNAGFQINGSAFVLHRGNIKLDKIRGFLKLLGLDTTNRKLLVMPTFDLFFTDADPPRDVRTIPDPDLDLLLSPIDDLVDRRNAIAHGVVDEIESVDLLLARGSFLLAFAHALHERLQMELLPFKVAGNGAQELGEPIAIFGGKVACFESATCQVAVGDTIVAGTGETLMPYRWSGVEGLQVNRVDFPELRLSEMTQFGVKVSFKVKNTHKFYVLRPVTT